MDYVDFYNRYYDYINQVFGDPGVRNVILTSLEIPVGAVAVEEGDNGRGDMWQHHVAFDPSGAKKCSVELRQQDISTDDIACQLYSLYNAAYYHGKISGLGPLESVTNKRSEATKTQALQRNVAKLVAFLNYVITIPAVIVELNDCAFVYQTGRNKGKPIAKIIPRIIDTLRDFESYGYMAFRNPARDEEM